MWDTVNNDSGKCARLAMAGSIYMRKKSLEATHPLPNTARESHPTTSRNNLPSSGKIVKNRVNSVTIADKVSQLPSEIRQ